MKTQAVSATLAGLLAAGVSLAGQQAQPTFRSKTDLVRVDASVVDLEGQPISGLTAQDFTLLDRGVPQPIAAFEEIHHDVRSVSPVGHRDVASNLADSKSEIMVLVLDDEHIRKEWTAHAREVVEDFVRDLNDDTLVALTSTSAKYRVELTSDRQRIIDVLEAFQGQAAHPAYIAPGFEGLPMPPKPSSPGSQYAAAPKAPSAMASLRGAGRKGQLEGPPWDGPTLFNALAEAARILASDQTRHKGLGWISSGEQYSPEGMREAINRMRQSGVTTYAIDPVGTAHANPGGAYESSGCLSFVWQPPCDPRTPWRAAADYARASLTQTARETGGIAIVDNDDLAGGVRQIVTNFGSYYTLGFYPADTTTPGPRALSVAVSRPQTRMNARMSYSLADALPPEPEKALPALVSGLVPRSDLPMRLFAATLPPDGPRTTGRIVVTIEVTASGATLAATTGLQDDLTYGVFAFDLKSGQVVASVSKKATLTLNPRVPGAAGAPADAIYAVETSLAVPPGRYQLRASGTSAKMGEAGSVYTLVDMPDYRAAPLAMSDIVLGDSPVPLARSSDSKAAAGLTSLSFAPTLVRTFAIGDRMHVYAEVVGRDGQSPAEGEVALIDASGVEVWRDAHALVSGSPRTIDLALVIPRVAPGAYALRVSVKDAAHTASREVAVTVK